MGIFGRAVKSISRKKTRSALVIVVLSFILAMLVSIPPSIQESQAITQKTIDNLLEVSQTVNDTLSTVACQIDCHLPTVAISNFGPNNGTIQQLPLFNVADYGNITSLDHVADVIPVFDQAVNDTEFLYSIYGLPLNDSILLSVYSQLLPSNITSGRNLQGGDSGVVVLQQGVADYFNVTVGGTVKILNHTFEVVGIDGYSSLNQTAVYMSLSDAQLITNNIGDVTDLMVFADSVYNVESLARKISLMYPTLSVSISSSLVYSIIQMQTQTAAQLQIAQSTMSAIESSGQTELAIVLAIDAAIILFIMLYTVRERTREIGTLKALGASSMAVLGQFMLEGILLSLIAGVVGIVIGTVGATSLANLLLPRPTQAGNSTVSSTGISLGSASSASISVTITPELVLLGLGVAVLLGAVGSLYPAWRAARTRSAEAMRYE